MAQYWTTNAFILMCMPLFYISSTIGERYYYPDKPYIDLSNETIQTCPNGCELCTDLRFICHQLSITSIPQTWPVTLQYLDLSHLPMKRHFPLQDAPFKRYSQLKYLDISYNTVTKIHNNLFEGLVQLEYLKQSDTLGINSYPQFDGLIAPGAFGPLKSLKYLDLRINCHIGLDNILLRLRDLPQNTSLDYVDLSDSNYKTRHREILSYKLRTSRLVAVKRLRVKVLKLDRNRISAIEGSFGGYLQSIEYLSLRMNYLVNFAGGFQWVNILFMYNLKVLDVGENARLPLHVQKLPYRQGQCVALPLKLEKLYIDNFQLSEKFKFYDDGLCFNAFSSFYFLDMTRSTLCGTGAPMTGLESLRYISLQSARLTMTDPDTFNCKYWPNIHTMLLGNIDLSPTFGNTDKDSFIFQNCSTFVSIDLENTKLSLLPKQTFKDMHQVRYINISGNRLNVLDIDLKNNLDLTLLNASSNLISHLTPAMISQLETIAAQPNHKLVVDLQKNPLLCDCRHLEFIKWIKETTVEFHNLNEYTCLSDDNLVYIKALVIGELELKCKIKMITITTVASGILIFLILMSIAIYAKRYRLEYLLLVSRQFAKRTLQTKKQADDYRKFQYHGFLSYSSLDDISVIVQIQKKMEEEFGLRLAIHDRDFIPGKYIIENITNYVEASRKVIVLMSNNYLESRWCNFEFELARNKRLDATYDAMVMIMLHDKEDLNKDKISKSLKSYIGQKTYLNWPKHSTQKPTFWLRLKEALDIGDIEPQNVDIGYDNDAMQEAGAVGASLSDSDEELIDTEKSKKAKNERSKAQNCKLQIHTEVYDNKKPLITK